MATNTVPTFTNHTGNGTAGPFNIGFNYIDKNEIIVRVNEVLKSTPTHYTFNSNTQITFTSGNEPASGLNIELRRSTNITTAKVDFQDGSVLTETDLDANTNQLLFALQENTDAVNADNLESSSIYLRDGSRTLTGNIVFEGSTKDAHETTLAPVDPTADRTINIPNVSGTLVTTGDTGTVTSAMIADGTIVNADINASAAIQGTKISPNFGSQNISTTGQFIGDGSQLTGITFTGIDQFLRKDIDVNDKTAVRDECLGVIHFGNNITFKKTLEIPNTTAGTSMSKILFEGNHADNYMEWTPSSDTFGKSLTFGNAVNIGAEGYWDLFRGSTGAYNLQFKQNKGTFTFSTAGMDNNPETTGTVGNSAITHNGFKILGHYNTDIPTSGSNQGDLSNELIADWFVLETDPKSFADIRTAGFANQVTLLRSNDNTILKVHKDGVDCLKGDIRIITNTGKLQFGVSQELEIYHDGSQSYIKDNGSGELFIQGSDALHLENSAGNKKYFRGVNGAGSELYHDGDLKLVTTETGIELRHSLNNVVGEVIRIARDSNVPGERYHSITTQNSGQGGNNFIKFNIHDVSTLTGQNEQLVINKNEVSLSYDGVKKIETSADGVNLPYNSKLQLGDSQDLQIFHDGSHCVIKDAQAGQLKLLTSTLAIKNANDNTNAATFVPAGATKLFFSGSKKLETTSSGITVTGSVTTEDMNMSNLNGTANEVDNTKGSWSIQEGADDLFIINRVSGKKYKFNLTEIS